MLAHTKRGRAPGEFVLTKPPSAAAGLLKHTLPWEAMGHEVRNVSVAALLGAGEGEIAVVLLELTLNSEL